MFSELIVVLILLNQFGVSFGRADNYFPTQLKNHFIKSFNTVKNRISNFFSDTFKKIENRRQRIKHAFYNFIQESFGNSNRKDYNTTGFTEELLESEMTAPQLIVYHGYSAQSHIVITVDGYVLTIHRILLESQGQVHNQSKLAIFHHGLLGSSEDWILLGPKKSLPYILCDAGFDVWLANARGNKYSRSHSSKMVESGDFWDFSWHEIGAYDLPAIIDYVKEATESKLEIHFIGHSMGATALLVFLTTSPNYNNILKSATLLAPLVFMYQVKGPLRMLAELHSKDDYYTVDLLEKYELHKTDEFPSKISEKFCHGRLEICANLLLLLANGDKNSLNGNLLKNVLSHVPAGGSTKTIAHYEQLLRNGKFQMFDYGKKINLKRYKTRSPPKYDLSNVTLRVILFTAKDDWLSTSPNILTLLSKLPNVLIHHIVKKDGFSHTDFVWSTYAPELIYYTLLSILERGYLENKIITS